MKIDVLSFTENEDGSANLQVDVDDSAKKRLIEIGLLSIIRDSVDHAFEEKITELEKRIKIALDIIGKGGEPNGMLERVLNTLNPLT